MCDVRQILPYPLTRGRPGGPPAIVTGADPERAAPFTIRHPSAAMNRVRPARERTTHPHPRGDRHRRPRIAASSDHDPPSSAARPRACHRRSPGVAVRVKLTPPGEGPPHPRPVCGTGAERLDRGVKLPDKSDHGTHWSDGATKPFPRTPFPARARNGCCPSRGTTAAAIPRCVRERAPVCRITLRSDRHSSHRPAGRLRPLGGTFDSGSDAAGIGSFPS